MSCMLDYFLSVTYSFDVIMTMTAMDDTATTVRHYFFVLSDAIRTLPNKRLSLPILLHLSVRLTHNILIYEHIRTKEKTQQDHSSHKV